MRERVPIRWGLAFGPPDDGVREAAEWVAKGVRTIKIKIGRPGTGLDEEMVRAIREGLGPDIDVMVDANSGYRTPQEAVGQELRVLEAVRPPARGAAREPAAPRGHGLGPVARSARPSSPTSPCATGPRPTTWLVRRPPTSWPSTSARRAACSRRTKAAAIGEAAGLPVTIGSQCELGIGTAAMAHVAVCLPEPGLRVRHHRPPALPGGHHRRAARLRGRGRATRRTLPASA